MRAFIHVLEMRDPAWRDKQMHESSPDGASSEKLARECRGYLPSQYYPEAVPGSMVNGVLCENLEHMTFEDAVFDLVVTQDVFEHVLDPGPAFAEIARTLKPSGLHVFTVPFYYWKDTLVRSVKTEAGIEYLEPPDYHGNPVDEKGSLVVTEWGPDLCDFIFRHSGMTTTIYQIRDNRLGIDGEFLEVFVSRKPSVPQAEAKKIQ